MAAGYHHIGLLRWSIESNEGLTNINIWQLRFAYADLTRRRSLLLGPRQQLINVNKTRPFPKSLTDAGIK